MSAVLVVGGVVISLDVNVCGEWDALVSDIEKYYTTTSEEKDSLSQLRTTAHNPKIPEHLARLRKLDVDTLGMCEICNVV
jgi:hypothetical protein